MSRKKTEEFCIKYIGEIAGKESAGMYQTLFKGMSNKEFDEWMEKLDSGKIKLQVFAPNGKSQLSSTKNFKIADKLGHDFFQRVTFGKDGDTPAYTPDMKFPILKLAFRRPVQLLSKKISVSKDSHSRDNWTGQVTNKSLSAKVSFPELQILSGMGMDSSMMEIMKNRGGDLGTEVAMNAAISRYGKVSQELIEPYSTGVTSTKTLRTLLKGAHIDNNI